MPKAYNIQDDVIVIDRDLTQLDLFVKKFLDVLKKHSDYLIVSGFVSISTGRSRGTEDVDVLVPVLEEEKFDALFKDLVENGFWCYQGDSSEDIYDYVKNMQSIRFAKVDEMFPNMEVIPINKTRTTKYFEFTHPQKIRISDFEFKIPPIEFEIIYKELILKGNKDIADAKHLRAFFSEFINENKFKEYEQIIKKELK